MAPGVQVLPEGGQRNELVSHEGHKGLCCSGPAAFDTGSPESAVSAAVAQHLPAHCLLFAQHLPTLLDLVFLRHLTIPDPADTAQKLQELENTIDPQ